MKLVVCFQQVLNAEGKKEHSLVHLESAERSCFQRGQEASALDVDRDK